MASGYSAHGIARRDSHLRLSGWEISQIRVLNERAAIIIEQSGKFLVTMASQGKLLQASCFQEERILAFLQKYKENHK